MGSNFMLVWGALPQRLIGLTIVLLIWTPAELMQAEQRFYRREAAQEEDTHDNIDEAGGDDSACLTGLLNSLSSAAGRSPPVLSGWTNATALASPCKHTAILTGVTCNNRSRVASILLPWANLSGTLPDSLSLCSSLTTLIMSGNSLTGFIPTSLGDLPDLSKLSLADNQLSGHIPVELATCFALSSLDLHSNNLSGSIPGQLGLLPLQYFDVSFNSLSGLIPSTLSNTSQGAPRFNASSFDHNPDLYGYPLGSMLPAPASSNGKHYITVVQAVGIALLAVAAVVVIVVCCLVARFCRTAKIQRNHVVERQRRQRSNADTQQEDGWKQVLIQLGSSSRL